MCKNTDKEMDVVHKIIVGAIKNKLNEVAEENIGQYTSVDAEYDLEEVRKINYFSRRRERVGVEITNIREEENEIQMGSLMHVIRIKNTKH